MATNHYTPIDRPTRRNWKARTALCGALAAGLLLGPVAASSANADSGGPHESPPVAPPPFDGARCHEHRSGSKPFDRSLPATQCSNKQAGRRRLPTALSYSAMNSNQCSARSRRSTQLMMSAFADTCEMSSIVDIRLMSAYADIMIVRTARDLGAAVRDARLRQGWTQAELADRIDVSRQWVISLEQGKASAELGPALRAVAMLGMVANLVEAPTRDAGIDLDRLLGDEP